MFEKVLIANRGEIACRIAATLHEMGVGSVAVYSEADRGARHVRVADEAYELGPADARESYLHIERIIEVAKKAGAQAIHPGYGFLAENAAFAEAIESAGLTFIGPTAEQIDAMGDKRTSRSLAEKAGVPVTPGVEGKNAKELAKGAKQLGYPVIVKAALGGGGKGMQVVTDEKALTEAIESAERLAAAAFGDAAVYIEKLIEHPRHVEVQVLGDGNGDAVHLFERECSLQRRHQKVVEECPSPSIDEATRKRMTDAALALTKQVKYRGAGTLEFLLGADGAFYFLEMNTRLQVEHPVTELATGVDLVRMQLEVAATGKLPIAQDEITLRAHAIEARVYAEDAAAGFLPQAGEAVRVDWPRGPFVRVDDGLSTGDHIPIHYDPILAKVVAAGREREDAVERLTWALDEALVHGVITNLPFLRAIMRDPVVHSGAFDTEWIEREFLDGFTAMASAPAPEQVLAVAAVAEAMGVGRSSNGKKATAEEPGLPDAFTSIGRWRLPGLDA